MSIYSGPLVIYFSPLGIIKPNVARDVLQTALSLIDSLTDSVTLFLQIFTTS